MADPLEEYLRRVLEQARARPAPRPAPPRPQSGPILEAELAEAAPMPARSPAASPFASSPAPAIDAPPQDLVEIIEPEKRSQARVHEVFDHQLGTISAPTAAEASAAAAASAKSVAEEIVEMLHSPGGVRKAFLLAEILRPPQERW